MSEVRIRSVSSRTVTVILIGERGAGRQAGTHMSTVNTYTGIAKLFLHGTTITAIKSSERNVQKFFSLRKQEFDNWRFDAAH